MIKGQEIALIIPARNEAACIAGVIALVPASVDRIIVVDNGSVDDTGAIASAAGAEVVKEAQPGYGRACLSGIAALAASPPAIVAFADGDGSDNHPRLELLLNTLIEEELDLVLARRVAATKAALSPQQRFGNWLATRLIKLFWGYPYRDLGPMRAISWRALGQIGMKDEDYGWTVEMQIKALQHRLKLKEIPVNYLARKAGRSKISRTATGVLKAGTKILWVVAREALTKRRARC